jgi:hypothetical protein
MSWGWVGCSSDEGWGLIMGDFDLFSCLMGYLGFCL